MRRLIGLAALVFVAILAWRVVGMLSTDAVGMGVGLIFGVLAGIPAALLVLATDRRRWRNDYDDSWEIVRTPPPPWQSEFRPDLTGADWHEAYARQRATAMPGMPIVQNPPEMRYRIEQPPVIVVNGVARRVYTPSHPFQLPGPPSPPPQQYQCGICKTIYTGHHCPGCGIDDFECPLTPEEAQQRQGRRFKVVGLETAIYNGEFCNQIGIHSDWFDEV